MRGIATLGNLEASFFRPWMIGNRRSKYWQIAGFIGILLMGSLFLFSDAEQMEAFIIRGVGFTWLGLIYLVMLRVAFTAQGGWNEWWLALPYPRFTLVVGKVVGLMFAGMQLIIYTLVVMAAHCLITSNMGWMHSFDLPAFLHAASFYLLYSFIGLPCAIALGLLSLLFQTGWWRIGLGLLFCIAPMLLASWMIMSFFHDPFTVFTSMASTIMLIGWPLALFFLWVVAKLGIKRLGNAHYSSEGSSTRQWAGQAASQKAAPGKDSFLLPDQSQAPISEKTVATHAETLLTAEKRNVKPRHPFWTLVSLERTRYRWIGPNASTKAKCISYPLIVLLLIISYWNGGDFEDVLSLQYMLLSLSYPMITIYALSGLHNDLQKGQGEWWLAFPHSRLVLLASRLYAYLTSMLGYMGLALLLAAAGVAVRNISSPIPGEHWSYLFGHLLYTAMPTFFAMLVNISIFQIVPLAYKDRRFSILLLPACTSYYIGIRYLKDWFYPTFRDYDNGILIVPDYWVHLFQLVGIGLPLGALCILVGAKYLNAYLNTSKTGWFQRLK